MLQIFIRVNKKNKNYKKTLSPLLKAQPLVVRQQREFFVSLASMSRIKAPPSPSL